MITLDLEPCLADHVLRSLQPLGKILLLSLLSSCRHYFCSNTLNPGPLTVLTRVLPVAFYLTAPAEVAGVAAGDLGVG
jgi:hypothetical protein